MTTINHRIKARSRRTISRRILDKLPLFCDMVALAAILIVVTLGLAVCIAFLVLLAQHVFKL
jgi:hypothetical protein